MSLKLTYYGQNDSVNCTPAVFLTGDPGTDQQTLTTAGYLGGVLVALVDSGLVNAGYSFQPSYEPAFGSIGNIVPVNDSTTDIYGTSEGRVPFATLLNGPGEFAGAIGPSGSRKAPVVRALWQGNVDFQGYDASSSFAIGQYIYAGGTTTSTVGKYVSSGRRATGAAAAAVGICTHVPSASEPWLGIASLL